MHETAKRLVILLDPTPGASHELTAHGCRCHCLPRDPGVESLDRVYLNVYQPKLQTPWAVFYFLREHYGDGAVSSHQMKAITEQFLQNIDDYAFEHQIDVITFAKA